VNYRHAYHAGNFGDVLKHLVLVALLERLTAKDKPLFFLDTHAGRGRYDLDSAEARRAGEAESGIRRLAATPGLPPAAHRYVELVRVLDPANAGRIRWYPGSPRIAAMLMRTGDRAALCELERREAQALADEFAGDARVAVHHRDGYEALKGLLPPRERRGLVLVDPPYEAQEREFDTVAAALEAAVLRRWPVGVYAAWYPIKHGATVARFHARLAARLPRLLVAELSLYPADSRAGLNGSGVVIANPPWQLDRPLAGSLPAVHAALSPQGSGATRVEWLAGEG